MLNVFSYKQAFWVVITVSTLWQLCALEHRCNKELLIRWYRIVTEKSKCFAKQENNSLKRNLLQRTKKKLACLLFHSTKSKSNPTIQATDTSVVWFGTSTELYCTALPSWSKSQAWPGALQYCTQLSATYFPYAFTSQQLYCVQYWTY